MGREGRVPDSALAGYISELYDTYRGLMYSTAYKYCGADVDAEAAVNDAILRLAKHADTLRALDEPALAVYIACTVQSVALNKRRRLGVERRRMADRDIGELSALGSAASPEDEYIEKETRRERLRHLREALAELGEADRELLTAKYLGGADDAALAARYGITEGSVRSRISRAKKRARRIMERKEGGDDRHNG